MERRRADLEKTAGRMGEESCEGRGFKEGRKCDT